jgi:hypothetical protein
MTPAVKPFLMADMSDENSLLVPRPLSRPSTPARRRRKPIHQGEAGFSSSVINLANTILGTSVKFAPAR